MISGGCLLVLDLQGSVGSGAIQTVFAVVLVKYRPVFRCFGNDSGFWHLLELVDAFCAVFFGKQI